MSAASALRTRLSKNLVAPLPEGAIAMSPVPEIVMVGDSAPVAAGQTTSTMTASSTRRGTCQMVPDGRVARIA